MEEEADVEHHLGAAELIGYGADSEGSFRGDLARHHCLHHRLFVGFPDDPSVVHHRAEPLEVLLLEIQRRRLLLVLAEQRLVEPLGLAAQNHLVQAVRAPAAHNRHVREQACLKEPALGAPQRRPVTLRLLVILGRVISRIIIILSCFLLLLRRGACGLLRHPPANSVLPLPSPIREFRPQGPHDVHATISQDSNTSRAK